MNDNLILIYLPFWALFFKSNVNLSRLLKTLASIVSTIYDAFEKRSPDGFSEFI